MFVYKILSTIIFYTLIPIYAVIRIINGKGVFGWGEKLGLFEKPELSDKVIMFHGVSVGEVIALENLIKKTKVVFPDYDIVVTTGTKTGQDIAKKKYSEIASFITYFPFDISPCVKRFFTKIHPSVIMIAETEIWPIFAYKCKALNIPLLTINARISDSTYNLYKLFGKFFEHVFANYVRILTQSEEDNNKYLSLGAPKGITKVMKNLKFDVKKSEGIIEIGKGDSRIIIAGSTHGEENPIVIDVFSKLKKEFPDIKLLIAPRHFNRVPEIQELAKKYDINFGLRSKNETFTDKDMVILDTMGELSRMYSICYFAFIGGSFNKTGGHNPLEATVYSKPAISGPSIHNFKDIYGLLGRSNAGKVVKNPDELKEYMIKLLSDKVFYEKACRDCETVFESQQGALDIVIDNLKDILK